MLIEPASRHGAHVSVENQVTRRITVIAGSVHITATFDTHPAAIDRILASAGLPAPAIIGADAAAAGPAGPAARPQTSGAKRDRPEVQRTEAMQPLPASVTNYHGSGFDTCAAPSETAMQAWSSHSPYGAVGIYLGGSDLACAQPNLTQSWLSHESAQGWHFIPMYVGPQAAFGELSKSPARQGAAAAADAVNQAKGLGFGPMTPLYYDMEGYQPKQAGSVLAFLSAWTSTLHALRYSSGVYSSSSSGMADLAQEFQGGRYAMPDVIFDALWNGQATTDDPLLSPGEWPNHHRLHQYRGNITEAHGGTTMRIDQDYLDVELPGNASPSPTPIGYQAGAAATLYTGLAFDSCTAPPLAAIRAWGRSPYHAIGVSIGGINRACSQPRLTASWITSVSERNWRLLPLYVGLQPPCLTGNGPTLEVKPNPQKIKPSTAASQGMAAADSAAAKAGALGMRNGSAIYEYLGDYSTADAACRNSVLSFVSAWTKELHRLGFLAGVYVSLSSGAQDLSRAYTSKSFARPDALWVAHWDRKPSLTGWTGVSDSMWAVHQRAKQYRGPHNVTYSGTTIQIDSDNLDVPVATVAYDYTVTSGTGLNARTGPSKSYRIVRTYAHASTVQAVCQTPGSAIGTSRVWDKLTDGTYVTDFYISTPSNRGSSPPLPRCGYPYQVTTSTLNEWNGPGTSYQIAGHLPYGALAWVTCQKAGSAVKTTSVWDKLQDSQWVTDYYLATPSKTTYSRPAPRCG